MKKFKQQFPIERMAKVFGVTRDSYYKWIYRGNSKRKTEDRILTDRNKTDILLPQEKIRFNEDSRTVEKRRVYMLKKSVYKRVDRPVENCA